MAQVLQTLIDRTSTYLIIFNLSIYIYLSRYLDLSFDLYLSIYLSLFICLSLYVYCTNQSICLPSIYFFSLSTFFSVDRVLMLLTDCCCLYTAENTLFSSIIHSPFSHSLSFFLLKGSVIISFFFSEYKPRKPPT